MTIPIDNFQTYHAWCMMHADLKRNKSIDLQAMHFQELTRLLKCLSSRRCRWVFIAHLQVGHSLLQYLILFLIHLPQNRCRHSGTICVSLIWSRQIAHWKCSLRGPRDSKTSATVSCTFTLLMSWEDFLWCTPTSSIPGYFSLEAIVEVVNLNQSYFASMNEWILWFVLTGFEVVLSLLPFFQKCWVVVLKLAG